VTDLANTLFSGNNKAQIDYFIYMPKDMQAKFENKFGNIYATDLTGIVNFKLSNGDFKANNLTGHLDLKLSFGNASINRIESANMNVNYGELELEKANEIILESKSSTFNIQKVGTINVNSRRDKFNIDEIGSISGKTSFSYLTLKQFFSIMEVNSEYGEINISGIDPGFHIIDLESKYSEIVLEMPQNISFDVDITHSESTQINFPEKYAEKLNYTEIDTKEDIYNTSGSIGKQSKDKGKVNISIKSGNVTIKESF
jgi:hypothetical protein